MKSAMQKLIQSIELLQMADAVIDPLGIVKMFATELLETEKTQIVEAHIAGQKFALDNHNPDSEEYFNNTYKK